MDRNSGQAGSPSEGATAPRKTVRNIIIVAVLGGVVVSGACLAIVGVTVHRGSQLDSSSKAYVQEVIPAIAGSWDVQALTSRGSPEFLDAAPAEKLQLLFDASSRRLGPLKRLGDVKGEASVMVNNGTARTTARYRVQAEFAQASATLDVMLIQHAGQWQVLGFHVNSDAFLKP